MVDGRSGKADGPRAALTVPAYRRWFLAQILSGSGALTQSVGMSWLIAQHTGSGVALGLLVLAITLPILLLGPFAGRLIDRIDRRILLLVTQTLFLLIGIGLVGCMLIGADAPPVLYGIAVVTGVVNAFDAPARQVYLMDILPRRMLPAAIGLYEVVMNAARVIGPGVAGALLATGSVLPCFIFNALAFVPTVWVLIRDRDSGVHSVAPEADAPRASVWAGLGWAFSRPTIVLMLALAAISGMLFNLPVTIPLVTTETFDLGGSAYGFLVAVFGAGALLGAFRAAMQAGEPRVARTTVLALATGALVLVAAIAPNVVVFAIALCLSGALGIWFIARANTLVQLAAPPDLRGQVMSVWNMAIPGMNPFTGLAAGWAADAISARAGFGLSGALFLLVAVIALGGAGLHRLRG